MVAIGRRVAAQLPSCGFNLKILDGCGCGQHATAAVWLALVRQQHPCSQTSKIKVVWNASTMPWKRLLQPSLLRFNHTSEVAGSALDTFGVPKELVSLTDSGCPKGNLANGECSPCGPGGCGRGHVGRRVAVCSRLRQWPHVTAPSSREAVGTSF